MAKTRAQKEEAVASLAAAFEGSKLAVLTDYRGLDVPGIDALRAKLREAGIPYTVAKNTIAKIAIAQTSRKPEDTAVFAGPVAIAFGQDEVEAAKIVCEFAKTNDALEVLGAIDEAGNVLSAEAVLALSKLPSREQLIAQVVGTIAAPLSGFVRVLNGNISGLVYVLKAIEEAKA